MPRGSLTCIAGTVPLVLVAPHGGRRNAARYPWNRGGLRTNDLHTAGLTITLARATGAAAIVNGSLDRNQVDLNRVDHTAERLPAFLDTIYEALVRAIEQHGRVTLLTVHGWNTTAPVIDVGLGCRPGRELAGDEPGPAVSSTFITRVLPAFTATCARHGLAVSVGRRYPARAPQNLIQLFTGRWREDERTSVARVARLAPHCDAMQLELGIPLRWPGPWRDAFVAALCESTPALLNPGGMPAGAPPQQPQARTAGATQRLEFVSRSACGMAAIDPRGGRLLLLGLHAGLDLFTHERVGDDDATSVGALSIRPAPHGANLAYRGPLSRFPDMKPFLDLEGGLAGAGIVQGDVSLAFRPVHPTDDACPFGSVVGRVNVAGGVTTIDGPAYRAEHGTRDASAWFDLGAGGRVVLFGDGDEAMLCDEGRHRPVRYVLTGSETAASITLIDAGEPRRIVVEMEHSVPIVRGRSHPATSVALTTYRHRDSRVGWGQRSLLGG